MDLQAGQTLSHYRLIEKIGQGGMGVVWKAIDQTLDREIALKILSGDFTGDQERLSRFEREAKLLGSLNHPNIATLHGFERQGEIPFLVMEHVPGETLAERIAAGPIPLDEGIPLLLQIAEGLEAAHDHGVVHRDLKPANVKITPAGRARILDFGLAKALGAGTEAGGSSAAVDASHSPTLVASATRQGVILGTAAYMSPEQARGKAVNRRADVWAFGCIAWEMLTGRQLFTGETISDILAAVLRAEVDWSGLPRSTPGWLAALLRRCLERDPRRRLRDIGEARIVLEDASQGQVVEIGAAEPEVRKATARSRLFWFASGMALATVLVLALTSAFRPPPPEPLLRKFGITVSEPNPGPVISPDGRMIAYLEGGRLWIRDLDSLESREIPDTEGAKLPFWSPDSAWLGFAMADSLWKVPSRGGERVRICMTPEGLDEVAGGIVWSEEGRVVYTTGNSGLLEVSAQGGAPVPFLEAGPDELDFHDLSLLPDGRGFLFIVHPREGGYRIGALSNGARVDFEEIPAGDVMGPIFSPSGHILYRTRIGSAGLWAAPFSLDRMELTGEPFLVASPAGIPSVSLDGTIVFSRYDTVPVRIALLDREGRVKEIVGREESAVHPSFSPDGQRVAVAAGRGADLHVLIHQIGTETRTQLTFEPGWNMFPEWSPDGQRILYGALGASVESNPVIRIRPADGRGEPRDLATGVTGEFMPDGEAIVYSNLAAARTVDISRIDLEEGSEPEPLLQAPGHMLAWPRISPDGRFLAYQSNESGLYEIYVTTYPEGGSRWQVSPDGGIAPRWNRAGDRLYYLQGYDLMEVPVRTAVELEFGAPRRLFSIPSTGQPVYPGFSEGYDVSPDGKRFLAIQNVEGRTGTTRIVVIQNWFAEFRE